MLPQYFPASTWLNGGGCSLRQASNPALLSKTDADLYWLSLQGMLIKKYRSLQKMATAYVVRLLWEGVAARHMGEPKATHGTNRLHELFFGGSKLTFIISNFKCVCGYGGEGCSCVDVYNIFSYSSFHDGITSWTARGLGVWSRWSRNLEVEWGCKSLSSICV